MLLVLGSFKGQHPKGNEKVFQPPMFRCELLVLGRVPIDNANLKGLYSNFMYNDLDGATSRKVDPVAFMDGLEKIKDMFPYMTHRVAVCHICPQFGCFVYGFHVGKYTIP